MCSGHGEQCLNQLLRFSDPLGGQGGWIDAEELGLGLRCNAPGDECFPSARWAE